VPKRWPAELKSSILEMLRSGMAPDAIERLFLSKGKECPPKGTMRYWASKVGISTAKPHPSKQPRARPTPVLAAKDLPAEVRSRLEGFFEKSLDHLNSADAIRDARNTKALTDSMANLLALAPDLLTYKDKISGEGGTSDSDDDANRVLRSMGIAAESAAEE